jgi:hypothetical protein
MEMDLRWAFKKISSIGKLCAINLTIDHWSTLLLFDYNIQPLTMFFFIAGPSSVFYSNGKDCRSECN